MVSNEQVATDLRLLNQAHNYRRWLYSSIRKGLGERILEIGSGIGNYTEFFLQNAEVWATDCEPEYLEKLKDRFGDLGNCTVSQLVLEPWDDGRKAEIREYRPDTIVCLNVLEHIENDRATLRAMVDCLSVGGHLVLVVPALMQLYSALDRKYGHYRRYNKQGIEKIVGEIDCVEIDQIQYVNVLGMWGWWFNHVLLKRTSLPSRQTKLFDSMVPVLALLERWFAPSVGLSLVVLIRRKA